MKKFIFLLIMGICFSIKPCMAGSYLERQHQKKEVVRATRSGCVSGLRVASFATNPPFGWVNVQYAKHRMQPLYTAHGYGIDLMKQIGAELNIPIEAVGYKSDQEAWHDFQIGRLDVIVGQYYDPKIRNVGHSYITPSFFPNVISIVFMKGKEKEVNTFNDLIGLKGIVRQDENFYPYIRNMLPEGLTIEDVTDSRQAFTKLLKGEADYLMASPYSAEAEARRFKLNQEIKMIKTPLLGQELFILFSAHAPCKQFKDKISEKLAQRRQDMPQIKRDLISYIDKWGLSFKDEPPLRKQIELEENPL